MKISINKSAKRVLSITLALVMLLGTLFTANIGVNITAGATTPIAEGTIDLLEYGSYLTEAGSTSTYYDTNVADDGETGADWANAIIIDSAEELVYLCKAAGDATIGKYYKVADGIAGFNLANKNLDIEGTLADNLNTITGSGKNHSNSNAYFQGHFDGNGAVAYGAWVNGGTYAGLFGVAKGEVTIKNLGVALSYFSASTAAGGIIGYHKADAMATVTIENCFVKDCYIQSTATGYSSSVGGVMGWANSAPSWKEADKGVDGNGDGDMVDTIYVNVAYNVNNCFVELDEQYFISAGEGTEGSSTVRTCHGGVVGGAGSNAVMVTNCVVLGVTPYSTSIYSAGNDVQHTGGASHYKNVYTDQATGVVQINYNTAWAHYQQDFSSVVFQLTPEQMQGSAAVSNMSLAWFSTWIPGADGEYPTLNQTGAESDTSFWSGAAASEFAGGTGTKEDPFIIKTADQLYRALSLVTDTTEGVASTESTSVAGGVQSDKMLKQGSTTDYVAVYTPYYYKVADGIKAFYLNSVYGSETLDGAKAMAATSNKKDWKPGKSFVGNLDGNGVTIYGMYSSTGQGLVYKLDGSSTVKNFNFDSCYSTSTGRSALVTTMLGTYTNDTTIINVSNISVRNSYIGTSYNVTATARTDSSGCYDIGSSVAGIIATQYTAEALTISNCLYDGISCERAIGSGSEATIDMIGGIISGGTSMNNVVVNGSVSLGAPIADEVYISGKEAHYTRYDANQGFPVHFNDCYTDIALNEITTAYPNKYDKLALINRVSTQDAYGKFDMPTLAWGSNWALVTVDSRTIPMPVVNTAEELLGSYSSILGSEAKTGKYASVGPYKGTNPYTYTLKGAGTAEDPFIIETDIQLARAIATGGMNLYDRLYYRLGNDIDISGGLWISQADMLTASSTYTYTPFGGSLDGNGHVITGLSVGAVDSAGLIPVLAAGGEVKNLHLRNASVLSSEFAGAIVGEQQARSTITGCSVENSTVDSKNGGYHIMGSVAGSFNTLYFITADGKYLYVDESGTLYGDYTDGLADLSTMTLTEGVWYKGGNDGSMPRLTNLNSHANDLDIAGDGKADGYGAADTTALRNRLLRKSAYNYINGDVSRNGSINIADLAVLQRTTVGGYGEMITDSFFGNVEAGAIRIYYGENDNYDAARKVELYLESLFPGTDIIKCVSASAGTVEGASSDSSKVYLHEGDKAESPDGKLDIIVGTLDNVNAYKANTVATAANTYAVTYDSANKVVWLQGANFTAVEQAAINFVNGCAVDGDVVYTVGSTELADEKKPITVKLDTNYDGTVDTDKTMYYAWGDEFEEDTVNTYNWQHNNQQTEGTQGSDGSYNNLEMVPIKDLGKVLAIEDGRLSMKRAHDKSLGGDVSWDGIVGSVALDVTPGEYNGYSQWTNGANGANSIDADGSDQYLTSGKITTSRGMLFKQGYIEFEGRLPADGHAFPAWWLMARPAQAQNNNGYDNSLYSKIYKINDNWNGSATWNQTDLDTYKYQIPSAIYEIDMIEVMQHSDRHYHATGEEYWGTSLGSTYHSSYKNVYKTSTEAVYMYFMNSTIHKWWNNGVYNNGTGDDTSDDKLYIHDWDNYQVLGGITNDAFSTTSSAGTWIHNIGSTTYDFGSPTSKSLGKYYYNTGSYNATAHNDLTATRRYGFSWNTDGESGFEATLYIYDGDTLRDTVPIASGMSELNAFLDGDKVAEADGALGSNASVYSDAKVFNQYMYILFDNKYYSSNDNIDISSNSSANMFTDLLEATGLKSFEIEYVRIYQEDGCRDIVTQETQGFNNNNHFGY